MTTPLQLTEILIQHKNWLENNYDEDQTKNAKQADLRYADLRSANLESADLRYANLESADLRYANLRSTNLEATNLESARLESANLESADLRYANLRSADLRTANLRSADLKFSVFPLWCGSFNIIVDQRLPFQLAYHICRLKSEDPEVKELQNLLIPYANKTHLIKDYNLPLIPP